MSKLLFYFLFGILWVINLLPLRVLYILSDILFFILYHLVSYRKKVSLTNLENAFPEKSSEEIHKLCRRFYRRMCDQIIESFKIIHISRKQILKRFSYVNPELITELYDSNKSVILITGHHGTWQWFLGLGLIAKHKILAVYQPPSFSDFSRIYDYVSNRFGVVPVPMKELYRAMVDSKSKNELTATFILGDQSPRPKGIKYWTNFLNQDTPTITGFERIAKKINQAVVYMHVERKRRGYYEVSFQKLSDEPKEIKDYDITEAYFRALEKTIVNQPELWLWTHRRWKHQRQKSSGEEIT